MLKLRENEKLYKLWLTVTAAAVFGLFLYIPLYYFAPNYFGRLYLLAYIAAPLVFVPCYLIFRGLGGGKEIKIYFLFCLLLTVLKICGGDLLHNDRSIYDEAALIITLGCWMGICYMGIPLVFDRNRRLLLLDIALIILCLAHTLLGIVAIYATISGQELLHPLTGKLLVGLSTGRLELFQQNSNTNGNWYFLICVFHLYLFSRYRKLWQKALIFAGFAVCYICLALSFSRASMLAFSLCVAMALTAFGLEKLKQKKLWQKILMVILVMSLGFVFSYKSFDPVSTALTGFSAEKQPQEQTQTNEDTTVDQTKIILSEEAAKLNERGMSSSGRVTLWIASLQSLGENPVRILTGSVNARDYTNAYIKEHYPADYAHYKDRMHHHNNYLEIFLQSGIVGFGLFAAFLFLLLRKMVKLYFTADAGFSDKIQVIILSGMLVHALFESPLFYTYDIRTVSFCLLAGYVLAAERELAQ